MWMTSMVCLGRQTKRAYFSVFYAMCCLSSVSDNVWAWTAITRKGLKIIWTFSPLGLQKHWSWGRSGNEAIFMKNSLQWQDIWLRWTSCPIILFILHTGWPNTLLPLLTLHQFCKIVLFVVEITMLPPSILHFLGRLDKLQLEDKPSNCLLLWFTEKVT